MQIAAGPDCGNTVTPSSPNGWKMRKNSLDPSFLGQLRFIRNVVCATWAAVWTTKYWLFYLKQYATVVDCAQEIGRAREQRMDVFEKRVLRLDDLFTRHGGVSKAVSDGYCEAARVCLDRHHSSPKGLHVLDEAKVLYCDVTWPMSDARARRAWANESDATTNGAYGVALASVELTRGLVAVCRTATRTGADYYLGKKDEVFEDLEASVRLEVSGTDHGNQSQIKTRLREKIEQAKRGHDNLPAIALVVGFQALTVLASDVR